jgi:hypothetical protein
MTPVIALLLRNKYFIFYASSFVPNPWIHKGVRNIHQEIDEGKNECHHQYPPLHKGKVTLGNGINYKPTHTRPSKDRLRNYRASKHGSELDSHHGNDRHQRIT